MVAPTPAARILIVDDDVTTRRRLQTLLEQKGYAVETVSTCREAVEHATHAAEATPYRVAIIDVRLPDGYGIEVLKTVKRLTPETTCLIITGYPNEEIDLASRGAGANDYFVKPLVVDQLIDYMSRGGYLTG